MIVGLSHFSSTPSKFRVFRHSARLCWWSAAGTQCACLCDEGETIVPSIFERLNFDEPSAERAGAALMRAPGSNGLFWKLPWHSSGAGCRIWMGRYSSMKRSQCAPFRLFWRGTGIWSDVLLVVFCRWSGGDLSQVGQCFISEWRGFSNGFIDVLYIYRYKLISG